MRSPTPPDEPRPGSAAAFRPGSPSVLDLVRLSPQPVFPPGGEDLYRQIARITDLEAGQVVLDAACDRGLSTTFLAQTYGVEAHGIDADPLLVQEAEERTRAAGLEGGILFQSTPLDDLPYKNGIFDLAIGEIGIGTLADPGRAVAELVRVTKSRGSVVLVSLTWTGHIPEDRREALVQHLGARPLLLVEWKQFLRDSGVVDLQVEDWSDATSSFRPARQPFHDIAEIFNLREKATILRRALGRWGWRGLRGAIAREQEIHALLSRNRVLGLSVIRGTKWD